MKKRILAMLLSLVLLLSAVPSFGFVASAATVKHTIEETFKWLDAQVGKQLNPDGIYPGECVDLILAYYDYLTGGHSGVSGNANQYVSNKVPAGFTRIKGATPQPGDICVQTGGTYGHVWIQGNGNVTYHSSYNSVKKVQKITKKFTTNGYYGVIRPNFKASVYSLDVNTVVDGTSYAKGVDGITFSVKINGAYAAQNVKDYYSESVASGATYEICDIKYPDKYVITGAMNVKGIYTATVSGATVCSLSFVTPKAVKSAQFDRNRYEVFNDSTTFEDAKKTAGLRGGHLVTISSKEENDFVFGLIKPYFTDLNHTFCYWIGASDEKQEGVWKWSDGSAAAYTNWESGEPSNSSGVENYAVIKSDNGRWNDLQHYTSSKIKGFVVEYEHVHSWVSGEVKAVASFGEAGKKVCTCTGCGETKEETIPAIDAVTLNTAKFTYNGKAKTPSVTVTDTRGNTLTQGTDYTVTYSNNKKPGYGTAKVLFSGNYTGTKTLSFTILPAKVKGLKATQTASSVKLTWSKTTGATGYRIYKYASGKYSLVKTVDTNSCTIKSLKSGTKYTYAVKAYKSVNGDKLVSSSYSDKLSVTTKPAAPKKLSVTFGSKKATLKWDKVTGATKYQIYVATSSGGTYKKIGTTAKLTFTKKELKSGKTYYFKVRAYNKVGDTVLYSAFSSVKKGKVK